MAKSEGTAAAPKAAKSTKPAAEPAAAGNVTRLKAWPKPIVRD